MSTYVVYRHGGNSANQPMCNKSAVGVLEASDSKEAKLEVNRYVTLYNNQYLSAEELPDGVPEEYQELCLLIRRRCFLCGKNEEVEAWKVVGEYMCRDCWDLEK